MVVYTPSILDEGLYLANMTLPHGYFWNDIIQNPGEPAELYIAISAAMDMSCCAIDPFLLHVLLSLHCLHPQLRSFLISVDAS